MKNNRTIVTVVCCLHGDEVFGFKVFRYLHKNISDFPGLKIILANEAALRARKRFIRQDLNRVFPGKSRGVYEEVLASQIMKEIGQTKYLLDIHTTTADIKMTPIVANFNKKIKKIINLSNSEEVAKMKRAFTKKSLIGQFDNAVSLEFNNYYARQKGVLGQVVQMVRGLLVDEKKSKKQRKVFFVNNVITKEEPVPTNVKNFIKYKNVYPFLLREKAYKNINGFSARRYIKHLV